MKRLRVRRVHPLLFGFALGLALPSGIQGQEWSLSSAADSALAHHPTLRRAEAILEGAIAGTDVMMAARIPSVSGTASLMRFEEPMIVAPLHAFDPTSPPRFDPTLVQGQAEIRYNVFDGGGRGARILAAEAEVEAAEAQGSTAEMDVLRSVVAAYTGVLSARKILEAADRRVVALEAEMDRAERRLEEGVVAPVEVARAEATLLEAQADRTSAAAETSASEQRLARTIGVPFENVAGAELGEVVVVAPISSEGPTTTLEASPLVVAAGGSVRAAGARLAEERAARLPSLDAAAGLLGFGSSDGHFVAEWQAGVRLSWPVFTGGSRTARIDRAEAHLRAAEAEMDQVRLQVADARDMALAAARAAEARSVALAASVAQWIEVARVEALALDEGAGVQQDYLAAEAALFRAEAGLARAEYDRILAHVSAARADGLFDRQWIDEALEEAP